MSLRVCRHRRTRAAAAVLAAVLVLLLAFSAAAVAAEARHDCSGADCEMCALMRTAVARLVLDGAALLAAVGLIPLLCCCAALTSGMARTAFSFSLIGDKVRLNN